MRSFSSCCLCCPQRMDRKILARLAKLEAENVELQEELLRVKQQYMLVTSSSSGGGGGGGGVVGGGGDVIGDETITKLRNQIEFAVSELKKFRIISKETSMISTTRLDKDLSPQARSMVATNRLNDDLSPQARSMVSTNRWDNDLSPKETSSKVTQPPVTQTDIFSLDDLLN